MEKICVILLCLAVCFSGCNADISTGNCSVCQSMPIPTLSHVILIFKDLFTDSDYTNLVFPVADQTATMTVDMSFTLYSITEFDEIAGTLSVIARLKMSWYDQYVIEKYVPKTHVLESLDVPQDDIWLPPITLFNSVDSLTPVGHSGYEATIALTNGYVQWSIGIVTKTSCTVNAEDYPFDRQECEIQFTPWAFEYTEIELSSDESEIDLEEFTENEEWAVTNTSVEITVAANRSIIHYKMTLARRPVFFLVNMIIPIILLGLLNSLCFVLPTDSGERMGFATNVFLTFAVYMTILASSIPQQSKPLTIMSYYIAIMLSVSSITTIISVFTLRISNRDPENEVPLGLNYMFAFLTCRVCRKRYREMGKNYDRLNDDDEETDSGCDEEAERMSDDLASNTRFRFGITWRVVGKTVDKMLFMLFLMGTLGVSGYFLTPLVMKLDMSII
ncbi:hypothetical protein FSP39_000885 [Pinctada imbricata]|uniref:Uncharacterized protein n=1 Tax=Pinctada imbricata TaxID=66713 RepID=A0AA89C8J4_PINIB|nr:hypothetical protein FSP39_000885 [Pinctada imbricata]